MMVDTIQENELEDIKPKKLVRFKTEVRTPKTTKNLASAHNYRN